MWVQHPQILKALSINLYLVSKILSLLVELHSIRQKWSKYPFKTKLQ